MPESRYIFGEFELDSASFELRRQGRTRKLERVPLERIPMTLLILLLERQGSVVTRQEIVDRLWGKDVFVDTDHGINTAIRKVRQALKDDPDRPRFVQTVSGKGYRFVADKNGQAPPAAVVIATAAEPQPTGAQPPRPGGAEASGRSPSSTAVPTANGSKAKTRVAIAALGFALAAAALGFQFRDRLFPGGHARQIHSIAVLPLANLSGDASQDYFADGMTDEVITMLAKNTSLRVISRTSAMQYKGVKRPLPDIARELGVDGILEGSIKRSPTGVHMTVQLIYAPTDSHVWAESYDRDVDQAYLLPSDLSQTIAKQVTTATSPPQPRRYVDPEAHDAYLHGRYFWFSFNVPETLPYFEKAIQLQPDYAAAWSGLADTYALAGMINRAPKEVMSKSLDAARKAVELDDSLPEAHNSMAAWYLFYGWDLPHADSESRRAIELNPNYGEAHYVRHYLMMAMNRLPDAESEEKRAVELDPFARPWGLGQFYIETRQYDAAINEFRQQHLARPNDDIIEMDLSKAYWLKGMYKESEEALEDGLRMENDQKALDAVHKAWVQGGETAVEKWGVESTKALAHKEYVSDLYIANTTAYTGDKEQTLNYLEEAYRRHEPELIKLQYEPVFDFLHKERRYQALVKQLGLGPVGP